MGKTGLLAAGAALALGTAALYQGLVVREYTVPTGKWRRGCSLRIGVVSDLHCTVYGCGQRVLVDLLDRQRPDLLLLPGDLVDESISPAGALEFLRRAPGIAPTYYAPGNHEYRSGRFPKIVRMIRACGIPVLLGRLVLLETAAGPLLLGGCEDIEKRRHVTGCDPVADMAEAFRPVAGSDALTVLMAHRPELYPVYRELGFDLTVSGHAHGGQIRLPFLCNGVIAPGQGLFPPYAGGCYDHGTMRHVVSRGASVYPGLPRVWNPPEIVMVEVRGTA